MVADLESKARRDLVLPLLDPFVHEFLDPAAVDADDVIVMVALIEFEHGRAALEVMPRHQPGGLELRQHAVDRCEADVLLGLEQPLVYVLGAHVPWRCAA